MLRFIIDFIQLLKISILLDKKRAQGLSIQTIVIAVIAILILLALVILFIAKWGVFKEDVDAVLTKKETLV